MKALTFFQPQATLVMLGEKLIDTRPRPWSYHGRIAVHASKSKTWLSKCHQEPFRSILERHNLKPSDLSLGMVLGTVEKSGYRPTEDVVNLISDQERSFGNYSPGRYAYPLSQPRPFHTPIPALGHQGIWEWGWPLCVACGPVAEPSDTQCRHGLFQRTFTPTESVQSIAAPGFPIGVEGLVLKPYGGNCCHGLDRDSCPQCMGWDTKCQHIRLNEDGICRQCGADKRSG